LRLYVLAEFRHHLLRHEPPAAVWRSGRPNLREVRRQARATPETSAPDIAEDVGIQPDRKADGRFKQPDGDE
jgi:hypothetical protein